MNSGYYANPNTVHGALQRGLGRGARRAMPAPDAAGLVADCLDHDYRWDGLVDERDVYLARLVRDLRMPIEPVVARLDHDDTFEVSLGVLDMLGRAGVEEAIEGVRDHVRRGDRWPDALETMARSWPAARWDDLYHVIADRIEGVDGVVWLSPPWTVWADRDTRIATAVRAAKNRRRPRPFVGEPSGALLALLRQPGRAGDWPAVLGELRRRPPEPEILDLADDLAGRRTVGRLHGLIEQLGAIAVPAARRWAAADGHPLTWAGLCVLAAHGTAEDVPALIGGLDWLDSRPHDRCGYDELAGGLARIGGPAAMAALPRLHRLWFSPHSYERAGYLRALVTLDPDGAPRKVAEGLWDCEADVRRLAVQRTPLDDHIRQRLEYLRDDPMETAEVRAAAGSRL